MTLALEGVVCFGFVACRVDRPSPLATMADLPLAFTSLVNAVFALMGTVGCPPLLAVVVGWSPPLLGVMVTVDAIRVE